MKKNTYIFTIFLFITRMSTSIMVDFDTSMQTAAYPFCMEYRNAAAQIILFRTLYNQLAPLLETQQNVTRIPHIIHHIWLGSALPEKYIAWRETWMDHHPDWTFILWTDNDKNYHHGLVTTAQTLADNMNKKITSIVIDIRDFPLQTKNLIARADNYGQRSDILRYEILYRFGGMYVDTDFSCLQSFSPLHNAYDFYIGIQPLETNLVQLGIGLVGSIPKHPILAYTLEQLANYDTNNAIVLATGPLFFTKMFHAKAGRDGYRDIAFPATYFYPWNYESTDEYAGCKKETRAIHHWHGSWMKPEAHVHS